MQLVSLNRISQAQHGASKAVDIYYQPDPIIYAPEDCTFVSYGQAGTPGTTNDAGLALKVRGASGLHLFGHTEKTLFTSGTAKRGQPLAVMGYTGFTQPDNKPESSHVHWWIQRPDGSYVYPPSIANEAFIKLGGGNMALNPNFVVDGIYAIAGRKLAVTDAAVQFHVKNSTPEGFVSGFFKNNDVKWMKLQADLTSVQSQLKIAQDRIKQLEAAPPVVTDDFEPFTLPPLFIKK